MNREGVKHGLQDIGAQSVRDLPRLSENGVIRFELRSPAAQREGAVHSVHTYETQRNINL